MVKCSQNVAIKTQEEEEEEVTITGRLREAFSESGCRHLAAHGQVKASQT